MNIKDIIKNNHVRFLRYRHGVMYYSVSVAGKPNEFMFPVPLSDVGSATLDAQDKAIIFMRFIRKAIDEGTFVPSFGDRTVPK